MKMLFRKQDILLEVSDWLAEDDPESRRKYLPDIPVEESIPRPELGNVDD